MCNNVIYDVGKLWCESMDLLLTYTCHEETCVEISTPTEVHW